MRNVNVSRRIDAPANEVWGVLADFPNIADWNGGVKTSFATGDAIEGIGAQRHCDLAPFGTLEETVRAWEPGSKLTISIDATTRLPIKQGLVDFGLHADADDRATTVQVDYDYETKWGPIGRLMGPMLDRQLTKGFTGFLADLDTAAHAADAT